MKSKLVFRLSILSLLWIFAAQPAFAGDAATVIFKSGQVVRIDDGYMSLVDAMAALNGKDTKHSIIKMNVAGSTLVLDIAEVVIVCRDSCSNVTIQHQLDPRRGGGNSNVNVDNSRTLIS